MENKKAIEGCKKKRITLAKLIEAFRGLPGLTCPCVNGSKDCERQKP